MDEKEKRFLIHGLIVIGICILIPVVIYIVNFWSHSFSTDPGNWGTFGDYIGGIMNPVIGFFTLIVTVYIANEVRKIEVENQKRAADVTYFPRLIIQHDQFYLYSTDKNSMPRILSYEAKGFDFVAPSNEISQPFVLKMFNIGIGSSYKIRCEITFPIKEAISLVDSSQTKLPAQEKISLTLTELPEISFLDTRGPKNMQRTQIVNTTTIREISHILNVSVDNKPYSLDLPNEIMEFYSILYYIWSNANDLNSLAGGFPSFTIKIVFHDIANNELRAKFKIRMKFGRGSLQASAHNILVEEEFEEASN